MTTTYKKLTWDSYKIQVESAVRDGNGATISTTYATKTEVTTGLGTKLDTSVAASTYATQTALAGKADKATSLAGYGITDGVTTNTAQTITAEKTHTAIIQGREDVRIRTMDYTLGTAPSADEWSKGLRLCDKNGDWIGAVQCWLDNDGHNESRLIVRDSVNNSGQLALFTDHATVPYRAYNSSNVNDAVTIGSLAANPSVIHATGNEEINGSKRFVLPIRKVNANMTQGKPASAFTSDLFSFQTSNGQVISEIFMLYGTDGSVKLIARNVNPDGTMGSSVTIATLRAAY